MYPRNAASPPRIAVGSVVQISDGAVQTTGVSVVVRPEGGAESAGGGTLAVGGTSQIWYYTPTQAETNYTAFVVSVYKSGCLPSSVTVVTTASDTSGYSKVADADVRSAVGLASANLDTQLDNVPTVTELTNAFTEIKGATWSSATDTLEHIRDKETDIETDTQDIQSRLPAALVSGRMSSSVQEMANGVVTAAAVATGAIDADALASDAVTEIWAKAMSELSAVPAVNGTVLEALSWIFTIARNKITQTSTTQTVFKDDGSTTLATSTVSDNGTTATRGEFS